MITYNTHRIIALLLLCLAMVSFPMQQEPVIKKAVPCISIDDPQGPFNKPFDPALRRASSILSGMGGALGGSFLGWYAGKNIIKPTNAWWTTEDRTSLITKTCALFGGIIAAKVASHYYASIRKKLGQTTFLDAIENDNVKQIKLWLEDGTVTHKDGIKKKKHPIMAGFARTHPSHACRYSRKL